MRPANSGVTETNASTIPGAIHSHSMINGTGKQLNRIEIVFDARKFTVKLAASLTATLETRGFSQMPRTHSLAQAGA